ncbi:MAG: Rho termination factor N-terminal domain-containing protein, partial [Bacilli bacterium]|nr:Rho termination factor N-terminal domain-containing protein [Bacilli bacterium]
KKPYVAGDKKPYVASEKKPFNQNRQEAKVEAPAAKTVAPKAEVKVEAKVEKTVAPKVEKVEVPKAKASVDFESMTVADLKSLCKDKGITGYSKLKKAELIEALK